MYNCVFTPIDKIEYKKYGIAVNKLIEDGLNSLTLMAFDKNQEIPTHTAPVEVCVMVLEGVVEFTLNNDDKEKLELQKGSMFIMKRETPHSVFAKTMAKMMLIKL